MRAIGVLAYAAMAVASGACAGETLVVGQAMFEPDATLSKAVRKCRIPELIDAQVLEQLRKGLPGEVTTDDRAGRTLRMRVIEVFGSSGGAWTGQKGIALRAELVEDGTPVASREFSRRASGGTSGLVSGTCAVFREIAQQLGEDVTAWVGQMVSVQGGKR